MKNSDEDLYNEASARDLSLVIQGVPGYARGLVKVERFHIPFFDQFIRMDVDAALKVI